MARTWSAIPLWLVRGFAVRTPGCGRQHHRIVTAAVEWLPQPHLPVTAVRVVAVYAQRLDGFRMLAQHHVFLVTRKANLFLRLRQLQRGHVTLRFRLMADCARDLHRRMHRLALGLVAVTGGAIVFFVEYPWVLNGSSLRHRRQKHESEAQY